MRTESLENLLNYENEEMTECKQYIINYESKLRNGKVPKLAISKQQPKDSPTEVLREDDIYSEEDDITADMTLPNNPNNTMTSSGKVYSKMSHKFYNSLKNKSTKARDTHTPSDIHSIASVYESKSAESRKKTKSNNLEKMREYEKKRERSHSPDKELVHVSDDMYVNYKEFKNRQHDTRQWATDRWHQLKTANNLEYVYNARIRSIVTNQEFAKYDSFYNTKNAAVTEYMPVDGLEQSESFNYAKLWHLKNLNSTLNRTFDDYQSTVNIIRSQRDIGKQSAASGVYTNPSNSVANQSKMLHYAHHLQSTPNKELLEKKVSERRIVELSGSGERNNVGTEAIANDPMELDEVVANMNSDKWRKSKEKVNYQVGNRPKSSDIGLIKNSSNGRPGSPNQLFVESKSVANNFSNSVVEVAVKLNEKNKNSSTKKLKSEVNIKNKINIMEELSPKNNNSKFPNKNIFDYEYNNKSPEYIDKTSKAMIEYTKERKEYKTVIKQLKLQKSRTKAKSIEKMVYKHTLEKTFELASEPKSKLISNVDKIEDIYNPKTLMNYRDLYNYKINTEQPGNDTEIYDYIPYTTKPFINYPKQKTKKKQIIIVSDKTPIPTDSYDNLEQKSNKTDNDKNSKTFLSKNSSIKSGGYKKEVKLVKKSSIITPYENKQYEFSVDESEVYMRNNLVSREQDAISEQRRNFDFIETEYQDFIKSDNDSQKIEYEQFQPKLQQYDHPSDMLDINYTDINEVNQPNEIEQSRNSIVDLEQVKADYGLTDEDAKQQLPMVSSKHLSPTQDKYISKNNSNVSIKKSNKSLKTVLSAKHDDSNAKGATESQIALLKDDNQVFNSDRAIFDHLIGSLNKTKLNKKLQVFLDKSENSKKEKFNLYDKNSMAQNDSNVYGKKKKHYNYYDYQRGTKNVKKFDNVLQDLLIK